MPGSCSRLFFCVCPFRMLRVIPSGPYHVCDHVEHISGADDLFARRRFEICTVRGGLVDLHVVYAHRDRIL